MKIRKQTVWGAKSYIMENKEAQENQENIQNFIPKDKPHFGLFAIRTAVCAVALCAVWIIYMCNFSAFKNISKWYRENFCTELISPKEVTCKTKSAAIKLRAKASEAVDIFKSSADA